MESVLHVMGAGVAIGEGNPEDWGGEENLGGGVRGGLEEVPMGGSEEGVGGGEIVVGGWGQPMVLITHQATWARRRS